MTTGTTRIRDALGVIVHGDEVPGLLVYGIGEPGWHHALRVPTGLGWREETRWVLTTDHADVLVVTLVIEDLSAVSARWPEPLESVSSALLEAGAVASWWMLEAAPYADPPSLFDPQAMGGVLGWRTAGESSGWPGLDDPVPDVPDAELLRLRALTAGLSDRE